MKAERDFVNWIGLKFQSSFEVRDQWQSVQFSFYFLSLTPSIFICRVKVWIVNVFQSRFYWQDVSIMLFLPSNTIQKHCSVFHKNHFCFLKQIFTLFQLNISSAMSCLYCYCYCNFLEITQQPFNIVRFKFNFTSEACSLPNFISVDFNLLENGFKKVDLMREEREMFFIS